MALTAQAKPALGFLTLVSGTHGSLTFASAVDELIVSASADCTLTWKSGQTTDPGSVPSSGTVTAALGGRRFLAGQKYTLRFKDGPSTTCAFKQASGASVDITVEANIPPTTI